MIVHNFLQFIILLNQNKILKKQYNKLMLKNKIIVKYIVFLSKCPLSLFKTIRDINIKTILKSSAIINYSKKVHSIPVRLHITSRRNKQVTHKFFK